MTTEERAIALLRSLPPEKQQEALSFIESLQQAKVDDAISIQSKSALEAAGHLVGSLEGGPADLSTNKTYMQGFGQ